MCGEHERSGQEGREPSGSSPRVRGTLAVHPAFERVRGIIPACAGNTRHRPCRAPPARDHPRVCGEHPTQTPRSRLTAGSSPRVRGTLVRIAASSHEHGIIPACAGNTRTVFRQCSRTRDHPRVCGEHRSDSLHFAQDLGSSPRVRGTPLTVHRRVERDGIIPACAGNTVGGFSRDRMQGDHPRVCGEHYHCIMPSVIGSGSSPRVRGTRAQGSPEGSQAGIIPACAGNTLNPLDGDFLNGDHPRVCGEHVRVTAPDMASTGSSPRVRGTRVYKVRQLLVFGIIPACAGNTILALLAFELYRDHPRVCGEHAGQ